MLTKIASAAWSAFGIALAILISVACYWAIPIAANSR